MINPAEEQIITSTLAGMKPLYPGQRVHVNIPTPVHELSRLSGACAEPCNPKQEFYTIEFRAAWSSNGEFTWVRAGS